MNFGLLVEGASLVCEHGSDSGKLRVSNCHGYQINGKSLINEDDAKYPENIPRFGTCSSPVFKDKPQKPPCFPDILDEQWISTEGPFRVDGKPAVTTMAFCACMTGRGMIRPEETGQDELLEMFAEKLLLLHLLFGFTFGIFCGDPINVCTGNFVDQKTDLETGGSFPLALKRTYNALDKRIGALGRGWRHSFGVSLEDKKDTIELTHEDGRVEIFKITPSGRYDAKDSCVRKKPQGIYELETAQGNVYTFESGRCVEICDANGNQTVFHYEGKRLASVANICGSFTFAYDESDRLTAVTDSAGRTVRYFYDEFGTLGSVENAIGTTTGYNYDSANRVMSAVDSSGEPIAFINAYDKKGRVEKQYLADGGVIQFEYDESWNRTIVTEQNGNRVRYYQNEQMQNVKTVYYDGHEETSYDDKGLKTRFRDKNGNESFYEYDSAGNMTKETNPLGGVTTLEYDKRNLPVKITAANAAVVQLAYDKSKNLTSITNPLGHLMQMQYHKGLPSQIDLPDGSQVGVSFDDKLNVSAVRAPTGGVTRYEYDQLNRVVATIDGKGGVTKFAYNDRDKLTRVTNADGERLTYEYSPRGRLIKVTDFAGGVVEYKYNAAGKVEEVVNQAGDSTKFAYDLMWNVTGVTDACGNEMKYSYDKLKRLVEAVDAEGNATRYEYDPKGNMTASVSPLGARTEIVYDALDRQQKVVAPDGAVTEFVYDAVGNLVQVTDALGNVTKLEYDLAKQLVGLTDALGNTTKFAYTALGKLAHVTNAKGERQTYSYYPGGLLKSVELPTGAGESYEYDANENVVKKTDALGHATAFRYDSLNRLVEVVSPLGHSRKFAYDALGKIAQVTNENGGVTRYKYSLLGDLVEVIDASGHSTKYDYDKARRLTKLEQFRLIDDAVAGIMVPEYQVTTYERDKNGKVVAVQTPLGTMEKFKYNEEGKLVWKLDADGLETLYEYNPTGKMSKVHYADGKIAEFFYTPLQQLTEVQDWLGTTKIELDPLGRATQVTDFDGKTVGYAWGNTGRREKLVYPDGKEIRYSYNGAGLLDTVHAPEGETRYVYDAVGRVRERLLPEELRTTYKFDPLGRISELVHHKHIDVLDRFNYSYDPLGNLTQIKKERKNLPEDSGLFQYDYDPLRRLTAVTHGKDVQRFGYDELGNRIQSQQGDLVTRYAYNAANQLVQMQAGDEVTDYGYDGRGNLIGVAENGALKQAFAFDATNRMVRAVTPDLQSCYVYDGFLNRVWVDDTRHVVDRTRAYDNLLMTEGAQNQRFSWGNELISACDQREIFYLQDHLGSPIRLMHNFGTPLAYDAFGMQTAGVGTSAKQPFGFTGYQTDAVSGMYFAQARYYMPGAGRFISEDVVKGSVATPKSLNAYTYCWNQPLGLVDKDGRTPIMYPYNDSGIAPPGSNWSPPQVPSGGYLYTDSGIPMSAPRDGDALPPWVQLASGFGQAIDRGIQDVRDRDRGFQHPVHDHTLDPYSGLSRLPDDDCIFRQIWNHMRHGSAFTTNCVDEVMTYFRRDGGSFAIFNDAWVIYTGWPSSMAIFDTIFLGRPDEWLLRHEFAHILQERELGLRYIGVAVPSLVSSILFPRYHHRMPWEVQTDELAREKLDPYHHVPDPLTWQEVRDMFRGGEPIYAPPEAFIP